MPEMFTMPFRPAFDSANRTIPGAQAWFTLTGTNTPSPVYSDSGLTTPHTNPLVADGLGRFPIAYLNPAVTYRVRIYLEDAEVGVDSPVTGHDYDPYTGQEQGAAGPQGDAGENATVLQIGTVSTIAPGGSATAAVNSLGSGLYSLDLGIPRGTAGASGALSDADYGDIVVSGTGTVLTVDAGAITSAKMANMAAATVKGRATGAGAGVPTDLAIGAGAATSVLDRAAGDGRYILQTASRSYEIFIPAGAWKARTTSGAASGATETTTNKINLDTFDFDQTTTEYIQCVFQMPKSWDEGTVSFRPVWTASAGSAAETVIFGFQGVAISNDDALDAAFGTAQTSSDALLATGDQHTGPYTAAITIGGSPAESDFVVFQAYRDVSDTLSADAKFLGATLKFTVNAQDDS